MASKYLKYVKYVISGGVAAFANITSLYVMTEYGHIYYLLSATISFLIGFIVSFALQKLWTFQDTGRVNMHWQAFLYFMTSLFGLGLNTFLIYILVEFVHVWYVAAAVLSGLVIAVINFSIYRKFIFAEALHTNIVDMHRYVVQREYFFKYFIAGLLGFSVFLSFYRLTESPPTWFDEGIIIQTASNVLSQGPKASLMVAPEHPVSGWYVTTAYPVTFPIAASFWLFGASLFSARIVMALFIVFFVIAVYALVRMEMVRWLMVSSLGLIVTFAPLYGNGKNVLGEVPGLLFLTLFLLCVRYLESEKSTWRLFLLAGLMLGLAVATKPIFLLLLPVVGVVLIYSHNLLTLQKVFAAIGGFLAAFLLWVWTQFGGDNWAAVLEHYANPNVTVMSNSIISNVFSFVTKIEPLYAFLLLVVWMLSFGVRVYRGYSISRAEWIGGLFSLLVYVAYLRTIGFYRHFLVGEMLALMYLPLSLKTIFSSLCQGVMSMFFSDARSQFLLGGIMLFLIGFQGYQILFSSWVATHYNSHRAASLEVLRSLPQDETIFLYNTPEAAIFLPRHMLYYQYIDISKKLQIGQNEIIRLSSGTPAFVLVHTDAIPTIDLSHYKILSTIDRYSLWHKK